MTQDELKRLYDEAKQIIKAEREKRRWVFRDKPDLMAAKVAEIDHLLSLLAQIKDVAKRGVTDGAEQGRLFDVPVQYQ